MTPFAFDAAKTPAENIAAFCVHMSTVDEKLAPLLFAALSELYPLPETQAQRNTARARVNAFIAGALAARLSDAQQDAAP